LLADEQLRDATEAPHVGAGGFVVWIVDVLTEALVIGDRLVQRTRERAELRLELLEGLCRPTDKLLTDLAGGIPHVDSGSVLRMAD